MLFGRISLLAATFLIGTTSAATAQPERMNFGDVNLPFTDLHERLEGKWTDISSCDDLTIEARGKVFTMMAAWRGTPQNREPFSIACEMEQQGHKVVGWASAEGRAGGSPRRWHFFLVELTTGDRVIVNGSTTGRTEKDDGNRVWLNGDMGEVWNATNGRRWSLPYKERSHHGDGSANLQFTSWLIGEGEFDLAALGISTGLAPEPPTNKEIVRGFRARIQQTYAKNGCGKGFGSKLQVAPVDVCVNYGEFKNIDCKITVSDGRAATCDLNMQVFVRSGTHPNFNQQFSKLDQPWRMKGLTFMHSPTTGWIWLAPDKDIHEIVPKDFRKR